MSPSSLVLVGVLTPSAGIVDALLWSILQRHLRLTSLYVLILFIIAAGAIMLHGVIELFSPRGARRGARVPAEMFVLAVCFGGCTAHSRATRGLYTQKSFLLVRKHGGVTRFPSRIRYVLVYDRQKEPSIDRGCNSRRWHRG
jgi:Vacuole effluxer Atg22 like